MTFSRRSFAIVYSTNPKKYAVVKSSGGAVVAPEGNTGNRFCGIFKVIKSNLHADYQKRLVACPMAKGWDRTRSFHVVVMDKVLQKGTLEGETDNRVTFPTHAIKDLVGTTWEMGFKFNAATCESSWAFIWDSRALYSNFWSVSDAGTGTSPKKASMKMLSPMKEACTSYGGGGGGGNGGVGITTALSSGSAWDPDQFEGWVRCS